MSSPFTGEFIGTMILIIFGDGVVANCLLKKSKAENAGWMVIVTGWAMGVIMGIFAAQATGSVQADINPAVTLAKMFNGLYDPGTALLTMLAQIAGAFAGGCFVWLYFLPHWEVTEDQGAKLSVFCTTPAIRKLPLNLICETMGTILLVFLVFAIFSKPVGTLAAGFGPYMVGMLVWGIGLSLGGPTGYAINPARDLGPRLAHAVLPIAGKGTSDWGYSWVPVVGPLVGASIAFGLARLLGLL
ncbi:MAG: MIP/aquaporin family protein [Candidatus Eremiobacteraeota bacterium]|nr:MIP/aquaporin family protein [Candidatus Eremiobacteraeota bacterium]